MVAVMGRMVRVLAGVVVSGAARIVSGRRNNTPRVWPEGMRGGLSGSKVRRGTTKPAGVYGERVRVNELEPGFRFIVLLARGATLGVR